MSMITIDVNDKKSRREQKRNRAEIQCVCVCVLPILLSLVYNYYLTCSCRVIDCCKVLSSRSVIIKADNIYFVTFPVSTMLTPEPPTINS